MTRGVHAVNRVVLGLLGVLLVLAGVALALATTDAAPRSGARLWADAADGARRAAGAVVDATSRTTTLWLGAAAALAVALLALWWVAVQRRGRARTAVVREGADGSTVPGQVVVTAAATEGLVHRLVRTGPDTVGASVTAVRRRRSDPRYDVVVAPRRGADPLAVATGVRAAAGRAERVLGTPVEPTVRLRASAVRRVRSRRRVS
ncbi:hypothetical protein [Kineosporia sp. R_H_3]|uniref:hypothetical protein n=1 Tax=Kineosporia sp. R_H_3 TaxID=1961848 RepID=UPI000B4B7EC1|nr:hypothetical protein [Kineosporia sp. R_H_3]